MNHAMGRFARLLPALTLLAACAASGPPPMTDLSMRECASAPDLTGARPLVLEGRALSADLDAAAPCWRTSEDSRSAYLVFQLPEAATPYLVKVTSTPQGQTLFSPRLV